MKAAPLAQSEWVPERLGKLGKWLSGGTPSMANSDYWGGDIPWVSPKDMKRSRLWDAIDHVTAKAIGNGTRLAPSHALLLVVRGMILAHTFPVARAEMPLAFNQDIKALVLRDDVDSEYLLWWLTAHKSMFLGITTESTHGTKRLPTDELNGVEINLPPLPEQRAIATALSDVDALLGGLDRLIAKKRDLKQAAMQQLLTGQTRLPGFHGEWETVAMRQVLSQNATYGIVTAGAFVQDGVKMLRGGDIVDGRINTDPPMVSREKAAEYARTALAKDDVVIALVGYPGASAKIPDELIGANISRAVGLLRTSGKVLPEFLVCFLNSSDGRRMVIAPSAGSAQQVVNLSALNKLQFRIPIIPEQTAIAAVLSDMDAELAALERRREKTHALKQAMMQELLTGRTRLVRQEKLGTGPC